MPDFRRLVRERVAALGLEAGAEADLVEELAEHLAQRYRELVVGGAPEEEALRAAAAELENLEPLASAPRRRPAAENAVPAGEARRGRVAGEFWRDLRYAARTLRKSPLFTSFAVLTLALGIGANTTVFTVIHTLILNPLPVPDTGTLAAVATVRDKTSGKAAELFPISLANLRDYQAKNRVFRSLAGYTSPRIVTLEAGGAPERMFAELVTGNYFTALGLAPARGRFFAPDEDGTPGAHPVAVMNFATWQTRFGGAADIVGRTLRLNHVVFTVIGVAPPRFIGVNAVFGPDLWIPSAMAELLLPGEMHGALRDRAKAVFQGVGRLAPGTSRARAAAEIGTIAAALAREYPAANQGRGATVLRLEDVIFGGSNPGAQRMPIVFGGVVLLAIVLIVLLIACSNVANLLLARAASRRQEMAVRLAMGASRARLARQLITESALLGVLGGLGGFLLGAGGLRLVWSFRGSDTAANLVTMKLDGTVFAYTLALAVVSALVFGAAPAVRASRADVADALKEDSRSGGRSRRKVTFANALLVGQVAFSFLSLVTAALFVRSIQRAYEIDPGFQTAHLAVLMASPGQAGYGAARGKAFYQEVRARVTALPGVVSASWASNMPLWGRQAAGLQVEGRQARSQADIVTTVVNTVDLDYFRTAGIALEQGRDFRDSDRADTAPVAIINDKLARDYWPGQDAIGRHVQLPSEKTARQVIGVAKTANYTALGEPAQPCVYVPLAQAYSDSMVLYTRTEGDPAGILTALQREVRAAGPQIYANDVRTGRTIVGQALYSAKAAVGLLSVFGLLALGLAGVGLYGLMAYSVHQRRREIGVRMALGARQSSVLRLVLGEGMSLVLAGVALGFGAALLAARALARMLYGVSATDPASVAAAAAVLLGVALLACYVPARAASRMDPLRALREE